MIESFRRSYPVYILIDVFLITMSFSLAYLMKYAYFRQRHMSIDIDNFTPYLFIFILWALFIIIAFSHKNLHTTDRGLSVPQELARLLWALLYASTLIGAVIFFAKYKFFSRQVFCINLILLFLLLGGFRITKRLILRHLIAKGFHNINILIVGAGRIGTLILEEIKKSPWWGFKVVGFLDDSQTGEVEGVPVVGVIDDFVIATKKCLVDEVIITLPLYEQTTAKLIKHAQKTGVGAKVIPFDFEDPPSTLNTVYVGPIPLLTYKERIYHPAEFIIKRLLDCIVSVLLLIVLLPLFIVLAILIRLDSPGPIFYIQPRIGRKGKLFNFYKFRSMVYNADGLKETLLDGNEIKGGVLFKIKNDPRITRAGRFLRRFSLDELPQLLNVLKGDMSLVGPRPPLAREVEEYAPLHMERLSVRPGMTGLSQIRGRSELSFQKYVKWDRWYVNNWSFGLDIRILLWTIPVVLKGKGAY